MSTFDELSEPPTMSVARASYTFDWTVLNRNAATGREDDGRDDDEQPGPDDGQFAMTVQ